MSEVKQASRNRREARKAARNQAAINADEQEAQLSDKIAEQRSAKVKTKPAAPKKPQKEQIAEERAAAKQQADEQEAAVTGGKPNVDSYFEPSDEDKAAGEAYVPKIRGKVPLSVLNEISRRQGLIIKSDAREIANAAGRAAYDVARGKREARKGPSKFQRMMDAQVNKAKAKKPGAEDGK